MLHATLSPARQPPPLPHGVDPVGHLAHAAEILALDAYSQLTLFDLAGANLSRATLQQANLRGADLSHANLHRADLSDAVLDATG